MSEQARYMYKKIL